MELLYRILGVAIIAAVLAGAGGSLALLNATVLRIRLDQRPRPLIVFVAVPSVLWLGVSIYLLAVVAADPGAANLWPLTIALMAFIWLLWIAIVWLATMLFRRLFRR